MTQDRIVRICLVVTPEVDASSLAGLHGAFNSFASLVGGSTRFETLLVLPNSLVAQTRFDGSVIDNVMGLTLPVQYTTSQVSDADAVIIPSLYLFREPWPRNPYPDLTQWLVQMRGRGALLCSACTGAMLLGPTGLLDGHEATQHWAFEKLFREHFPKVRLDIRKALLRTGAEGGIIMSGASAAWHDLLIHLLTHFAGASQARELANYFLLQPHDLGQAPFILFQEQRHHGDATVLEAQKWLKANLEANNPVDQVVARVGISERTFKRRFRNATGYSPIEYVQHLRIAKAKNLLETSALPVEEISWRVGYEDAAFFRRLFKRLTGVAPRIYRRNFQIKPL